MRRRFVQGAHAGTVLGFPIFIEGSVLYLGPTIAVVALAEGSSDGLLHVLIAFPILFASVFAHELAHALAARHLGVPVRHIALTWFGGYAAFWVQPPRWRGAAIALAGPAANLALGGVLFALTADLPDPHTLQLGDGFTLVRAQQPTLIEHAARTGALINLALGAFNLLPGLPLDGGHILRTALSTRISWARAGWIAAWVGIVIGAASIAYAIWVESFWMLFTGIFVCAAAWAERRALRDA